MSARAEHWVLQICEQNEDLRPVQCHVLQLLAIRHDHELGMAWPSVARMAAESHYTERAIYKALDELVGSGLLHRSYGDLPRKSRRERVKLGNRYQFPGLDDISVDDEPRLVGGRPRDAEDEPGSSEPDAVEMNLAPVVDERDVTAQSRADEPDTHVTPDRTATRSVAYVRNEQAQDRAPDEAPPRRAQNEEPDVGVPPRWEELVPGVFHGLPDGSGEVVLLKARCPRCDQGFPIAELRDGELPEHPCELARRPIDSRPRSPGNLGDHLRRRRHREPVPSDVHTELAVLAEERARAGPNQVPAELLAEHERLLALARNRAVGSLPEGDPK